MLVTNLINIDNTIDKDIQNTNGVVHENNNNKSSINF